VFTIATANIAVWGFKFNPIKQDSIMAENATHTTKKTIPKKVE
jgi:hypothetical protein